MTIISLENQTLPYPDPHSKKFSKKKCQIFLYVQLSIKMHYATVVSESVDH